MTPRNRDDLQDLLEDMLLQCLDDDVRDDVTLSWDAGEVPADHLLYFRVRIKPGSKAYRTLLGTKGAHYKALCEVMRLMARTDGFALELDIQDQE